MKKSLRSPALHKVVQDYIKQYILEHGLKPGDPLPPEGQLVEDLGVGRSSVREAVKSLQSLGILDVKHGDGLYVRELNFDPMLETFQFGMQFDPHTLAELLQIRLWLEAAVIGDAVKRIGEREFRELDLLMHTWETRIQEKEDYFDLDEEFHRIIYGVLNNQSLMKLFSVFWIAFLGLEIDAIRDSDPAEELRSHHIILDAIKAHDPVRARKETLKHFDHVKMRIQQYIESVDSNVGLQ